MKITNKTDSSVINKIATQNISNNRTLNLAVVFSYINNEPTNFDRTNLSPQVIS